MKRTSTATFLLTEDPESNSGKFVVVGPFVGSAVVGAAVVVEVESVVLARSDLDVVDEGVVEGNSKGGIMVVRGKEVVEVAIGRGVAVVVVNSIMVGVVVVSEEQSLVRTVEV